MIDDGDMSIRIPNTLMLEQRSIFTESLCLQTICMSYSIRQRAYFNKDRAEEHSPTLSNALALLHECDGFFATIPTHMSLKHSPIPTDQRARILLLHIYYYYTHCIVSRDFLVQKVDSDICYLENQTPPGSDDRRETLALSEDCVDSAHKGITAGWDLGIVSHSWLDMN